MHMRLGKTTFACRFSCDGWHMHNKKDGLRYLSLFSLASVTDPKQDDVRAINIVFGWFAVIVGRPKRKKTNEA